MIELDDEILPENKSNPNVKNVKSRNNTAPIEFDPLLLLFDPFNPLGSSFDALNATKFRLNITTPTVTDITARINMTTRITIKTIIRRSQIFLIEET